MSLSNPIVPNHKVVSGISEGQLSRQTSPFDGNAPREESTFFKDAEKIREIEE